MAEEKKSASKQRKKPAAPKQEAPKPAAEKPAPKAKPVAKDEFHELRERLLRDYKGRLSTEQIEQRINIIKQSKENK